MWQGYGFATPVLGGTEFFFQKCTPPPRREKLVTFQGQNTLFVLHLQESLTNFDSLPHQFEIASGAAAYPYRLTPLKQALTADCLAVEEEISLGQRVTRPEFFLL